MQRATNHDVISTEHLLKWTHLPPFTPRFDNNCQIKFYMPSLEMCGLLMVYILENSQYITETELINWQTVSSKLHWLHPNPAHPSESTLKSWLLCGKSSRHSSLKGPLSPPRCQGTSYLQLVANSLKASLYCCLEIISYLRRYFTSLFLHLTFERILPSQGIQPFSHIFFFYHSKHSFTVAWHKRGGDTLVNLYFKEFILIEEKMQI